MKKTVVVAGVALFWTATGCVFGSGSTAPEQLVVYPPPPDTARLQFLLSITDSRDIGDSPSVIDRLIGANPEDERAISAPYGLAPGNGELIVCEPLAGRLVVIDLRERKFEFFQPGGAGRLLAPTNAVVDDQGWLYVADGGRGDVAIFDSSRTFIGALDVGDGARPADVEVAHGRIWVTDLARNRVNVFDRDSRELLNRFPEVGADTTYRLASPANLTVTGDAVYVSDVIRNAVRVFSLEGEYLRSVGGPGQGFGQFARAKGVAHDRRGRVYVVDALLGHVQIFDRQDQLLTFFGGMGGGPGVMALPATVAVDYDNNDFFRQYVAPHFELHYVVYVTNQAGDNAVNVYGFVGPEGG